MNSQHISITPHHNPNPNRCRTFTTTFFSTPIHTTVTSTPAIAREWVYNLRNTHRHLLSSSSLVVALGVQWHPSSSSAATLQLCVNTTCLIFQLHHSPTIPATLRNLLLDDRVTFVGVHNGSDRSFLRNSIHCLEVECLADLAVDQGFGNASMEFMASQVLGFHGVRKPRDISMSDWEKYWLTVGQIQYACVDAYVSFLLAQAFGYPHFDDEEEEEEEEEEDDYYGYVDYVRSSGGFGGFDPSDWRNYVWGDDYLDYDDYCNPLNYDEFGEYDPDNCNPFNLYLSDFEFEDEDDDDL